MKKIAALSIFATTLLISGGTVFAGTPSCEVKSPLTYTAATVVEQDITGLDACIKYDQMQVTGAVTLGSATISFNISGFTPAIGNSFKIIDNDGTDPVVGTFAGLAEGSTFTSAGVSYKMSYKGGDGNDVVLSVVTLQSAAAATPSTPNTGLKPAQQLSILLASVPVVALLLVKKIAVRE
jgi:fibronectin-binding autotransporter adhesin